jgi:hypothetical protein
MSYFVFTNNKINENITRSLQSSKIKTAVKSCFHVLPKNSFLPKLLIPNQSPKGFFFTSLLWELRRSVQDKPSESSLIGDGSV